jgi:endonuclease/exonuclease/phosphatase (EEP) superfamily protein YafD
MGEDGETRNEVDGSGSNEPLDQVDARPAAEPAERAVRDKAWWRDRLVAVTWIGLIFLWLVVAGWVLRLGESFQLTWMLWSGLHLLLLFGWVALAVGLSLRRRVLVAVAVATVLAQLAIAWPMLPWPHGDLGHGRLVSIGSVNLYESNPDLEAAARTILDDPPDILVLEEYTHTARKVFESSGLIEHYPYFVEHPGIATNGTAVYSRHPVDETRYEIIDPATLTVEARLPGGRRLQIIVVHVFPPQSYDGGLWHRDMNRLGRRLRAKTGRWIAIGDFNATSDHRQYRDLLGDGRRDAHQVTGRGYARSWPANKVIPPMFLIDHAILSPGVGASGTRERTIPGTDHRMIEVDVTTG